MRRYGPLTSRHLVVTSLVVALVAAQLGWWVVFTVRESRARLRVERARLTTACQFQAELFAHRLGQLETCLRVHGASGRDAAQMTPVRREMVHALEVIQGATCVEGWQLDGDSPRVRVMVGDRCLAAQLRSWPEWFQLPADLQMTGAESELPGVQLPPPFDQRRISPTADAWRDPLDRHHGRIRMFLSEGGFFALLLTVLVLVLRRTVRRERELEHQHRNFLSAITHELKSPLAAMRLSLETVLRGRADPTASMRFLENALQDTERLQSLVQKVLEVTRYGRVGATLKLRPAELSSVVADAVDTFSRRATVAGARLDADIDPGIWADIDEEAFPIVISNLLENAIKYGGAIPRVGVTLGMEGDRAVMKVSDNGKGIPEEEVPFIFERFFRGGNEMTRTTQGTGLGLYLVRQIISAHGGTVEVAASGATGTTFRVTLPEARVMEESV